MTKRRALPVATRKAVNTGARIVTRLAVASMFAAAAALAAVPVGYRYVGSRVVSAGYVVYWYWNAGYVETGVTGASFVARMYARAVDVNQERPYVAEIRCDTRTYREFGSQGWYEPIDDGEPIAAVMRAGCDGARAVTLAERNARLGAGPLPPAASAGVAERSSAGATTPPVPAPPVPVPPALAAAAPAAPAASDERPRSAAAPPPPTVAKDEPADARRVDACVRFAEIRGSPAGDATITNTCAFPVEVTLCYKGGRAGLHDCPTPIRGKRSDSLGPGVTHVLPEYRRATHQGIAWVACRGTMGSVFPRLEAAGGKGGCF